MTVPLSCHALWARLGERDVLRGVELELAAGQVLAVVGPNGAGKSTLLRCLAGELAPSRGEVRVGAVPLRATPLRALALGRAVLPQSVEVSLPLSVLDLVLLGRAPHPGRGDAPHDRAVALGCLERVGLVDFASRLVSSLSGGEQRRAHLARVLAQLEPIEPGKVLLLDEPTEALDVASHEALRLTLREVAAVGAAVVAVLHDLSLAARVASDLALLHEGVVAARGAPAEVLPSEAATRAFGVPLDVVRLSGDRVAVVPR